MEIWKPVLNWETFYEVSSLGRVRNIAPAANNRYGDGNVLQNNANIKNGYLSVHLKRAGQKAQKYVHILVCEAFHGPRPPGMQCRHLNGDKADCTKDNVAWGTRSQNEKDKAAHGTSNRGSRHGLSKLTELQVRAIRVDLAAGMSQRAISLHYGVCQQTISDIATGKRWAHL